MALAKWRWSAALGIGLAAALTLTACTDPGNESVGTEGGVTSPDTGTPDAVAQPPAEPTTESPGPTAPPKEPTTEEVRQYSTKDGMFTWTLPAGWTVAPGEFWEVESPDETDYPGQPYEYVGFQNAAQTIGFDVETGNASIKHGRPWPELIEVLDAKHMPEVPQSELYGEVWYRAALVHSYDTPGSPGEYELWVSVAEGGDPRGATGDDLWDSWVFTTPRVEGYEQEAGNSFLGYTGQAEAEQITGREGEEAVRALLETEEYAELRDVATSMVVEIP
ncbi:hypothetical protein [Citricoccus alkalitolerans]|uniref:Lipoprotein n=1 Tax=Citricoccus alkalitolerans TaxID=246603 RepID=A0ABV8Y2P0_9MICC